MFCDSVIKTFKAGDTINLYVISVTIQQCDDIEQSSTSKVVVVVVVVVKVMIIMKLFLFENGT